MGTARDAIVEPQETPAYQGAPGQTRLEAIHLVAEDGSAVSRKVYRVVNVKTDPHLRDLALDGELHRLPDGRRLLMPFVYHDPDRRKFALVIPSELSHLEFKEWSALMTELAEDTTATVPAYVRDAMTVVGISALKRFAELSPKPDDSEWMEADDSDLEEDDADSEYGPEQFPFLRNTSPPSPAPERSGGEHNAPQARAQDLEAWEGRLRAATAKLKQREQAVAQKLEALHHTAQVVPDDDTSSEWQEVVAHELGHDDATMVASVSSLALQADIHQRSATEAALRRAVTEAVPSLPDVVPSRSVRGRRPTSEPVRRVRASSERDKNDRGYEEVSRPGAGRLVVEGEPDVAPPEAFNRRPSEVMAARTVDEDLWLFAALDSEQYATLGRAPEFLLQCVMREGRPVVVLSVVSTRDGRPAARLALDGLEAMARTVLTSLEHTFRAHLALYVDGSFRETLTLASLREGVARAITEFIEGLPAGQALVDGATAVEHVLRAPPPVDSEDLPFGPARRPMSTTKTVLHAVEQLQSWLRPERQREAMLVYSVPRHVMEASTRRVLRAAVSYGIALSADAATACIDLGVVANRTQLVANQLAAFRARIQQGENDLDGSGTRRNWEDLFAQAKLCGMAIEPELAAFAAASHVPTILPPPVQDRGELGTVSITKLEEMLHMPEHRAAAFRELCRRKEEPALPLLFASLESAPPSDIALLSPYLARFGETLADPVSQALSSANAQVRQASALLVGHLKLRRGLAQLAKQLDLEPSPIWPEMARAMADFGNAALRVVIRALEKAEHPERFTVTLGHLANHGCLREVENLESHEITDVSRAARNALARRSRLQWEDLAVREQRTLPENSPAARFSQAFYAESAKLAI